MKILAALQATPLLEKFFTIFQEEAGHFRLVGGSIRNILLNLPHGDFDLASNLLPEELLTLAKKKNIKALPTGLKHGTITFIIAGQALEITSLREDVVNYGRHALVTFTKDWQADAKRRDLTINAFYLDHQGQLYDYFNGFADLKKRKIRFIGPAEKRIKEDYLRILRFFRFYSQLPEFSLDQAGITACFAQSQQLTRLSAERIWQELKKILLAKNAKKALFLMFEQAILKAVLPRLKPENLSFFKDHLPTEAILRLALLLIDQAHQLSPVAITAIIKQLALSRKEQYRLKNFLLLGPQLATNFTLPLIRPELRRLGLGAFKELIDFLLMVNLISPTNQLVEKIRAWQNLPALPLNGKDLLAKNLRGAKLGQKLGELDLLWFESNFSLSKQALLEHINAKAKLNC